MEVGVFGGLEELFIGKDKELFDSFLSANNVGALETSVSDETSNPNNNNVVSANLQEQVSNDATDVEMVPPLLDEDFDEVMENFLKRSQETEQISEEMITQKVDQALTVLALLDLEQNLVVHHGENLVVVVDDEKEKEIQGAHHGETLVDDDVEKEVHPDDHSPHHEAVPGGFMPSGGAAWRTPSGRSGGIRRNFPGNHHRYHNYSKYLSWNARNGNRNCGRFSDQSRVRPSPWNSLTTPGGVLGRSAPVPVPPSFSSSSSSSASLSDGGGSSSTTFLLGGVLDISSFKFDLQPAPPRNNNLHVSPLGQHSYTSAGSSSSTFPRTPLNNIGQGEAYFGGGALPQRYAESGVGLSQQPQSRFENFVSSYQRYCNIRLSNGSSCYRPEWPGKRKREADVELPPGWEVVKRTRKNGKSKGQVDKYYIHTVTRQRFRSLPELYRSLNLQPYGLGA